MSTLAQSALLMTLRVKSFAPKRKDPRVTASVLKQHGVTAKELGAWSTTLLPARATDPIAAVCSRIRKYHTSMTLTWDRDGTGLLPGVKYFDYHLAMAALRTEWQTAVDTFVSNYPTYLSEAQTTLNGLFNPSLYPSPRSVRSKFDFRLEAEPIPVAGDFRIAMSQAERAQLAAQLEERLTEATLTAQKDLLRRMAEPLSTLVERLAKPDHPIRDGLLEKLHRTLEDVSAYNVTNDPAIETLKRQIQTAIDPFTAEQLTHSTVLRQSAAAKAQAILDQMSAWGSPVEP